MARTRFKRDTKGRNHQPSLSHQTRPHVHKRRHDNSSNHRHNNSRRSNRPTTFDEINVSHSSIHETWKRELGGLIRYYIHQRWPNVNAKDAENEIERMYYRSGCSTIQTKETILDALGVLIKNTKEFVNIDMAVERTVVPDPNMKSTKDKKGVILHQIQKAGEGPAHSHQTWTNVIIPLWAVGQSFFFQVVNHTALDLACEMILDGKHVIAKNVPIPSRSTRTVKPDGNRYFERHKWMLQPAKRISFQQQYDVSNSTNTTVKQQDNVDVTALSQTRNTTKRYNGIKPSYTKRVCNVTYPCPTKFGWTFTGSVELSHVEFYEKQFGFTTVRMDFYYTTATVKTTLIHPTTGLNQLFRNTVNGDEWLCILKDPRCHTGRGYRRRVDKMMNDDNVPTTTMEDDVKMEEEEEDFDQEVDDTNDILDSNTNNPPSTTTQNNDNTTYYAKNTNYNFQTQGHANRRVEMGKLQQCTKYAKWEETAKKEWAVLHAKFYIAVANRMNRDGSGGRRRVDSNHRRARDRGGRQRRHLEKLPEQAQVVDVKSAENATLGTKFQSVGGSAHHSRRPPMRSNVRMERIKGLTDDDKWKGGPIFECKLYYRAEDVITTLDVDDNDDDDGGDNEEKDLEMSVKEQSHEDGHDDNNKVIVSLETYKNEKINQVQQYHLENCAMRPEHADDELKVCLHKIRSGQSVADVDEVVEIYYANVIKGEFLK